MQTSTIFSLLDVPIDFGGFLFRFSPGFDSILLFFIPGCNWISVLRSRPLFLSIILQSSAVKDAVSKENKSSHLPSFFLLSVKNFSLHSRCRTRFALTHTHTHSLLFPLSRISYRLYGGFFHG